MVGESEVYNNPSFIFLQLYHTTSLREGASGRLPLLLPGGEVGGGGEERGEEEGGREGGDI